MRCALILTVKDEAESLPRLLESLASQTSKPDEIIVTDGGSTDATVSILQKASRGLPIRVLERPGANISQGRNAAIGQTDAEIIASLDAGVRLDPHWFESISKPFLSQAAPDVVSGFFLPDPHGAFETALAATTLPTVREIRPAAFLPSSRSVAYRRDAWARAKGYPEWLDYCEDLVFDLALRREGCRFQFQPDAVVYFRPRSTPARFFRQYYLYARGDGKANLWLERHLIRYGTYLIAIPLSFALIPYAIPVSALMWIIGAVALFGTPYRRLVGMWQALSRSEKALAVAWVPLIRVTGDVAKMIGYPVGVWWRATNRTSKG